MSLSSERKQMRHDKIIELVTKNPLSMKELSEAINASYHTVRNDVLELADAGKISPTGETRLSGMLFRPGRVRPMPMVYHKASNQTLPITAIVDSFGKNPNDSASARAALDVPAIATELLYILALSVDTGHPNHERIESKNRLITALRTRLTTDVLHIESILGIAKDMLRNENLWNAAGLEAVSGDSLFDAHHIISIYENSLRDKD